MFSVAVLCKLPKTSKQQFIANRSHVFRKNLFRKSLLRFSLLCFCNSIRRKAIIKSKSVNKDSRIYVNQALH